MHTYVEYTFMYTLKTTQSIQVKNTILSVHTAIHTRRRIYRYEHTHTYAVKMNFQETTVSCIIIYIPRSMSANPNGAMWNDISDDDYI